MDLATGLRPPTMTTAGEPPDRPPSRRKRPSPGRGPPRPKYPSDIIDYTRRRRPDAKVVIRVPLERSDEWEELRCLLGVDTTHATVIHWLLDGSRGRIDGLREAASVEAARLLQDALHDTPIVEEHSMDDHVSPGVDHQHLVSSLFLLLLFLV